MIIKYIGKNVEFTEGMKKYTAKKLKRLEKYFVMNEDTEVRVLARTYPKHVQKVEITIPTKFGILRSEKTTDDYYASVDSAMDALEDQIRRMKTKLIKRHKDSLTDVFIAQEPSVDTSITREKQVIMEAMDPDEAVLHSALSDHSFYLFTNSETGCPAVVYKRADGTYGLIEGR